MRADSGRKLVSVIAALVLVVGLVPATALAAGADVSHAGAQRSEEDVEAAVAAMLGAGDYVEGEAVVCVSAAPVPGGALTAQSADAGDLLASAETLSSVTAGQYAAATGEAVPVEKAPDGALSAQSASDGDAVRIVLVHRDDMGTEQLLRALLADPQVLSAEPNYLMGFSEDADEAVQLMAATSSLGSQNAGETAYDFTPYQWFSAGAEWSTPQYLPGATNPGIRSPHWNEQGQENAGGVVAIMDSGVDYAHPDLQGVMYHFSPALQEQLGCGEYGYAPSREDKTNPMDYYKHGTHCAGIAAAQWNGFGVSGVANGVQVCVVSIAKSETSADYSYDTVVKGYDFLVRAAKAGVDIRAVNCSFDNSPTNNAASAMIQAAGEAGIVTCVAAGNSHTDLDSGYFDLATNQQSPYILRVDASRQQDDRAWFSCYGRYTTDVFAPGGGILSTVPTGVDSAWRYFPQADSNPMVKETEFDGSSQLPRAYTDGPDGRVSLTVSRAADMSVDGDGKSAKFDIDMYMGDGAAIYVDIPVPSDLNLADVQDLSIALYPDDVEFSDVVMSVEVGEDEFLNLTQDDGDPNASRCDSGLYGWAIGGVHISSSTGKTPYMRTEGSSSYIRVRFAGKCNDYKTPEHETKRTTVYLDQLAVGKRGNDGYLPYCYMNGTSMATPVVTGSAAVASSTVSASSPGERAKETVRILKGAMHQTDGYSGLCKQGGQIDLGILGQSDKYVPVLESAEVSGGSIILKGAFFGASAGAMTVGGVAVQSSSWSAAEITVPWPDGVASGLVPIAVRSANGEACAAFMLSAPDDDPQHADLYERDLVAPNLRADGKSTTACPYSLVATDGGVLFAAAGDVDDRMDSSTRYLFRSDDAGASWSAIRLPQDLKDVSLAAGEGALFVLGATPAESRAPVKERHLYRLDVSKGSFEHLGDYDASPDGGEMQYATSLAYANASLYAIDCYADGTMMNPSHMRIREFDGSYAPVDICTLKHEYGPTGSYYAPKVSVCGNSIYVCDLQKEIIPGSGDHRFGLERVDVASDGAIFSTDLSASLANLDKDIEVEDVCMAASAEGVYFIGNGLSALLPAGASYTDTFFLKNGETTFEPYSRTLSLAPVYQPSATCVDGWLYAFAESEYEAHPVFGRATEVEPDPAITYTVVSGDGSAWTKGSSDALAFTVKRSEADDETYRRFAGIEIDGKAVDASGYSTSAGSLVLKLKPSLLGALSVGGHELTARFDDGTARAKFAVRASTSPVSPSPKTGDRLALIGIVLAAVAAVALACAVRARRALRE